MFRDCKNPMTYAERNIQSEVSRPRRGRMARTTCMESISRNTAFSAFGTGFTTSPWCASTGSLSTFSAAGAVVDGRTAALGAAVALAAEAGTAADGGKFVAAGFVADAAGAVTPPASGAAMGGFCVAGGGAAEP